MWVATASFHTNTYRVNSGSLNTKVFLSPWHVANVCFRFIHWRYFTKSAAVVSVLELKNSPGNRIFYRRPFVLMSLLGFSYRLFVCLVLLFVALRPISPFHGIYLPFSLVDENVQPCYLPLDDMQLLSNDLYLAYVSALWTIGSPTAFLGPLWSSVVCQIVKSILQECCRHWKLICLLGSSLLVHFLSLILVADYLMVVVTWLLFVWSNGKDLRHLKICAVPLSLLDLEIQWLLLLQSIVAALHTWYPKNVTSSLPKIHFAGFITNPYSFNRLKRGSQVFHMFFFSFRGDKHGTYKCIRKIQTLSSPTRESLSPWLDYFRGKMRLHQSPRGWCPSVRILIGWPRGGSRYRRGCETAVIDRWVVSLLCETTGNATVLFAPEHVHRWRNVFGHFPVYN